MQPQKEHPSDSNSLKDALSSASPASVPKAAKNQAQNESQLLLLQIKDLVHNAAQPVTTILTLAELLCTNEHLDEASLEDIKAITQQANLLSDIIHELQAALMKAEPKRL